MEHWEVKESVLEALDRAELAWAMDQEGSGLVVLVQGLDLEELYLVVLWQGLAQEKSDLEVQVKVTEQEGLLDLGALVQVLHPELAWCLVARALPTDHRQELGLEELALDLDQVQELDLEVRFKCSFTK